MILYHGSNHIIDKPLYGAGKKHNDYGIGFYCTENIELAKEWSVSDNLDGYVNIYDMDTDGLSILDINGQNYTIIHWLNILINNNLRTKIQPIFEIQYSIAFLFTSNYSSGMRHSKTGYTRCSPPVCLMLTTRIPGTWEIFAKRPKSGMCLHPISPMNRELDEKR